MAKVNATVNPQGLQKTLRNFEMESAKMDMSEEMSMYTDFLYYWATYCEFS